MSDFSGLFTRRYSRLHCYFLFLHLVICLSSVGDRDEEMGFSDCFFFFFLSLGRFSLLSF